MTEKVQINVRIPKSLLVSLERECKACGCAQNAVVSMAILERVRAMAAHRRTATVPLAGQLEMEVEAVNAGDNAKAQGRG